MYKHIINIKQIDIVVNYLLAFSQSLKMPRPKRSRINKDRSNITETGPRTRDLVECNCMLRCHGSKWVDPRTFERHQNEYNEYQTMASESYKSSQSKKSESKCINVASTSKKISKGKEKEKEIIPAKENQNLTYSSSSDDDYTPIDIPKRRKRYYKFCDTISDQNNKKEPSPIEEDYKDVENTVDSENSIETEQEDGYNLSEDDILFEDFTAPDFNDFDDFDFNLNMNISFNDAWILIWILKYQSRFRLSDVAIDSLVKFFRMVLLDIDDIRFKDFPTSSYMLRKLLGIGKQTNTYAVCPDCNALYKISEILPSGQSKDGFKCIHVEFPNHPRQNQRRPCGAELTKLVPAIKDNIRKPKMIYPLPSLKMQLTTSANLIRRNIS